MDIITLLNTQPGNHTGSQPRPAALAGPRPDALDFGQLVAQLASPAASAALPLAISMATTGAESGQAGKNAQAPAQPALSELPPAMALAEALRDSLLHGTTAQGPVESLPDEVELLEASEAVATTAPSAPVEVSSETVAAAMIAPLATPGGASGSVEPGTSARNHPASLAVAATALGGHSAGEPVAPALQNQSTVSADGASSLVFPPSQPAAGSPAAGDQAAWTSVQQQAAATTEGGQPRAEAPLAAGHGGDPLAGPSQTTTAGNGGSSAVAQASITQGLSSPAWPQQFSHQVLQFVQRGEQQVELRLHPADLGPLSISLRVDDQGAQAQFLSAHASVRAAVEQAIPQLREALAEQGIALGEAQVGEQGFAHTGEHSPSGSEHTPEGADTGPVADSGAGVAGEPTAEPRGLVDTFA